MFLESAGNVRSRLTIQRESTWVRRLLHARSFGTLRMGLALALLLTSTLQSFVAQAHIHVPSSAAPGGGYVVFYTSTQPSTASDVIDNAAKRTRGDSSSTCPLCQVLAFNGAPLAHSAHAVLAPVLLHSTVAIDRVPPTSIAAVSYSWTGRGPPLE
jgi:hypothetical protein